jgi:Peptidase U49.
VEIPIILDGENFMCFNDNNQTKAEKIFEEKIDKKHIQREEFEMLLEKVKDGEAIILSPEDEVLQLQSDLKMDTLVYSNDMILDMIIDKVRKYTEDKELKRLIDSVKVGNLQDFITGRAYQEYSDNSHYTEIGRYFIQTIQQVSDIAASLFMSGEMNLSPLHCLALLKVNCAIIEGINNKENVLYIPAYSYAQKLMKIVDDNLDKYFTDLLVYYGREICEMAIAFILGHELGHHYFAHIDNNISVRDSSWIKEHEADQFGMKFALEYMYASIDEEDYVLPDKYKHIHKNVDYRILGIIVAFISSRLFDKRALEESELHPSLQSREDTIWEEIIRCIDKKNLENVMSKKEDLNNVILNLHKLNELISEIEVND